MECDGTTYPIVVETHDILPTSSKKGDYLGYLPDMDQSQHSITIMTVRRPVEERLRHKFMCHMKVYMLCGLVTMVTWIYLAMTSSPRPGDIWSVLRHLYMYSMSMTVSLFILSALTWIWGLIVYVSLDEWLQPSNHVQVSDHVTDSPANKDFQRSLLGYSVFLTGFIYMCITLDCARVLLKNYNENWMLYTPEYTLMLLFLPVLTCFIQSVLTSTYLYHLIFTTTGKPTSTMVDDKFPSFQRQEV